MMDPMLSGAKDWSVCARTWVSNFMTDSYGVNSWTPACMDTSASKSYSGNPVCGDGLVEGEEQCDCGARDCKDVDPCCDKATCKLATGAQCSALGECCDKSTCNFQSNAFVCRAAVGSCDVADTCAGNAQTCPADKHAAVGLACETPEHKVAGACFGGECQSRDDQCLAIAKKYSASFNGQCSWKATGDGACGPLFCGKKGSTSCSGLSLDGGKVHGNEGAPCGGGSLCYQAKCVTPEKVAYEMNGGDAKAKADADNKAKMDADAKATADVKAKAKADEDTAKKAEIDAEAKKADEKAAADRKASDEAKADASAKKAAADAETDQKAKDARAAEAAKADSDAQNKEAAAKSSADKKEAADKAANDNEAKKAAEDKKDQMATVTTAAPKTTTQSTQAPMPKPDCAGVVGGTKESDACGVCGGDDTTCADGVTKEVQGEIALVGIKDGKDITSKMDRAIREAIAAELGLTDADDVTLDYNDKIIVGMKSDASAGGAATSRRRLLSSDL